MPVPSSAQPSTGVGRRRADARGRRPTAIAVDLGSGRARIWVAGFGTRAAPTAEALTRSACLVRRGRIVDEAGCVSLLTRLLRTFPQPLAAGSTIVACRPVHAAFADEDVLRRVVATAFDPSRVLLIDTVRAAAIGSAAATGVLLIADVGAQLTEVAVLLDGRVAASRGAELGTSGVASEGTPHLLAGVVTRLVADIGRDPQMRRLTAAALARGVVVVDDGAASPELTIRLAANLGTPVRPLPRPGSPQSTALLSRLSPPADPRHRGHLIPWPATARPPMVATVSRSPPSRTPLPQCERASSVTSTVHDLIDLLRKTLEHQLKRRTNHLDEQRTVNSPTAPVTTTTPWPRCSPPPVKPFTTPPKRCDAWSTACTAAANAAPQASLCNGCKSFRTHGSACSASRQRPGDRRHRVQ
jgi:rod shape-determining protein MreB and related proteins